MKTRERINEPIFTYTALGGRRFTFRGQLSDGYKRSRTRCGKGGVADEYHCAKRNRNAHPRDSTFPVGRKVFKEVRRGRESASALIGLGHGTPGHNYRRDFNDHRVRSICDDDADALAKVRLQLDCMAFEILSGLGVGQWGNTEAAHRRSTAYGIKTFEAGTSSPVPMQDRDKVEDWTDRAGRMAGFAHFGRRPRGADLGACNSSISRLSFPAALMALDRAGPKDKLRA